MENTVKDAVQAAVAGFDLAKAIDLGMAIQKIGADLLEKAYKAALEQNPKLEKCTAESFIGALLQMLHLGLDLDHVSLIPARNPNSPVLIQGISMEDQEEYVCLFRLTYKGYVELANKRILPEGGHELGSCYAQ